MDEFILLSPDIKLPKLEKGVTINVTLVFDGHLHPDIIYELENGTVKYLDDALGKRIPARCKII